MNGALGPNMLHIFFIFSRSALSGVSQKCSETILGGLEKKIYKRKKGCSLKNE
jgi:hypothetical protein